MSSELRGAEPAVDFNRDVRPLLAEHCLQCHGPDKAEGGLRLHESDAARKTLEGGRRAIVPGRPQDSELLKRIAATDADERMPPEKEPLKPEQVAVLRRWIEQGGEYSVHWAFKPLARPAPPSVKHAAAVRNPIDQFIVARLEAEGLTPSNEADRFTLIKRLSYDLLGLLPKPEEVDRFVADDSPGAYETLVDRLLDSPHFGERWGRHWLDMARYADSDGYEKDKARPDAYVFRDWVIDALNSDLPFDQFTIQQIAGDLLPGAAPSARIATAFNRQTLTNEEGGVDQEEYRVAAVFDRTETLGSVWLGLTVGCARCHSHKYDPISHQDYYRLFAFFNDADETSASLPVKAKNMDEYLAKSEPIRQAIAARKAALAPLQQAWEVEQRERLNALPAAPLAVEPLELARVASTGNGVEFEPQADGSLLAVEKMSEKASGKASEKSEKSEKSEERTVEKASSPPSDKADGAGGGEDYIVIARPKSPGITGLRIDALRDDKLPKQGPGRANSGNFVLTGLSVDVVDASGQVVREVKLQRATADHEQTSFKAADVLSGKNAPKQGWAVGGKIGASHNLTVRTFEPLTLADGESLRVTLRQNYGSKHALGRFKVSALTGDARGLHLPANIITALEMYPEKRIASTKQSLFDFFAAQDPQLRELETQQTALDREYQVEFRGVRTLGASVRGRKTHRFDRGEFLQPVEEVTPGFIGSGFMSTSTNAPTRLTRLDLARWLVGESNPLTPRVAANHVWDRLFGGGIVRTPSDFGLRGERPANPELLDWLAVAYRDDLRWSTKRLIKTIVMSATYRQSSAVRPELLERDPGNELLARQNRPRVEGEIVRDLALDAAGLLSPKVGGPSVFPPMPADLAKLSYANNFSWTDSKGEDRYRRGMYTFFKRTIPHPTLMTFDCPDANVACVHRSVSNTPLQALTLLNNESFVEAAQALAKRVLAGGQPNDGGDSARLERAMRLCLVRRPSTDEVERFAGLLAAARAYYAGHEDAAKQIVGQHAAPGVPLAESAAWTATLRVLLNLDEFITRD